MNEKAYIRRRTYTGSITLPYLVEYIPFKPSGRWKLVHHARDAEDADLSSPTFYAEHQTVRRRLPWFFPIIEREWIHEDDLVLRIPRSEEVFECHG